jgi:hypothetical protein
LTKIKPAPPAQPAGVAGDAGGFRCLRLDAVIKIDAAGNRR